VAIAYIVAVARHDGDREVAGWGVARNLVWGRGHFEGERVGTPFALLKCLRTHTN